jgi:hypothetical protein
LCRHKRHLLHFTTLWPRIDGICSRAKRIPGVFASSAKVPVSYSTASQPLSAPPSCQVAELCSRICTPHHSTSIESTNSRRQRDPSFAYASDTHVRLRKVYKPCASTPPSTLRVITAMVSFLSLSVLSSFLVLGVLAQSAFQQNLTNAGIQASFPGDSNYATASKACEYSYILKNMTLMAVLQLIFATRISLLP